MNIQYFHQKSWGILGFGLEGKSTLAFLLRQVQEQNILPKKITIYDKNEQDLRAYEKNEAFELVVYHEDDYLEKSLEEEIIFKSPGISLKNLLVSDEVEQALRKRIYSQTEMTLQAFREKTLAVTGSKGKSTTSTLSYLLQENAKLLGNIGVACLDAYDTLAQEEQLKAVIELSSHQLEFMQTSPRVALLLNFYEEHLDHYRSLEHYYQAKLNIFRYQKEQDFSLFSLDNEALYERLTKLSSDGQLKAQKIGFSLQRECLEAFQRSQKEGLLEHLNLFVYIEKKEKHQLSLHFYNKEGEKFKQYHFEALPFSLSGIHHAMDLAMAFVGSYLLNQGVEISALEALENSASFDTYKLRAEHIFHSFEALEHRLEDCGVHLNRRWFNDSISTIPESTLLALNTLGQVDVLILGGKDRGVNYKVLEDFLMTGKVKVVIGLPDTSRRMLEECPSLREKIQFVLVEDMEEAVQKALTLSQENQCILLSPAASSYNVYKSFEERGRHFKSCIQKLAQE